MWREGTTFPGKKIIKVWLRRFLSRLHHMLIKQAGTLDDTSILDNYKVNVELFTANRPKWVGTQDGADQKQSMT